MSQTYSLTAERLPLRPHLRCFLNDLDVLYSFATYNLICKPFLMVAGVTMPGGGGGVLGVGEFKMFL